MKKSVYLGKDAKNAVAFQLTASRKTTVLQSANTESKSNESSRAITEHVTLECRVSLPCLKILSVSGLFFSFKEKDD